MPSISKIVVTGGPCGGKTSALSRIQTALSHLGYTVLVVPETATALISGGVAPWTCGTNEEYQKCQMKLQLQKEQVFEQAARTMDADKIVIVCDRGELDNKAYMTEEEFARVLRYLDTSEAELRDSYDAVFHLVTAAKGAEEFYTLENNGARYETVDQARALDDKFIEAWTGHPYLRVIDNRHDFEGKLTQLVREISCFLGELAPYVIERKFLIEYPSIAWLESLPNCQRVPIVQHYLRSDPGHEMRVRQRGRAGEAVFTFTETAFDGAHKKLVRQQKLTEREYEMLLLQTDPKTREIRKTRYCLTYEGQYFEIDVFPCWNDQALVEIELSGEEVEVVFPPELKVLREVTDDPSYRNAAIASKPVGATH